MKDNNIKNVSIPKGMDVESINLIKAKFLCSLPISLGINPDNKKDKVTVTIN